MRNGRLRWLLIGIPLLCTAGAVFVFIFQLLFGRDSFIEGTVVDNTTGRPLSGVQVVVSNRGWGFIDGQLVWDKDFVYPAVSDREGKFRITYRVGSSAHVIATQEGYRTYDDWHERNSRIAINLVPE